MNSEQPQVTIVLAVRDGWEQTLRTLLALVESTRGLGTETIVVDDGSTDETAVALPRLPGLQALRAEVPQGLARARSQGAALARGRLVAFLGNGVVPGANWLAPLLAAFERDALVGAAHPATAQLASDGLVFRTDVFRRLGGFDPGYRDCLAELDLGFRLTDQGLRLAPVPESELVITAPWGLGVAPSPADEGLLLARWGGRLAGPASTTSQPAGPPPGARPRATFEELLEVIASGEEVPVDALLPHLTQRSRKARCTANLALAKASCRAGTAAHVRRAHVFAQRAWLLSGFSPTMLADYLAVLRLAGDTPGIREAHKRLGMRAAARGDIDQAIQHFNRHHYAFATQDRMDRFEFDFDVLDAVEQLARPHRSGAPGPAWPLPGQPLRLAYLLKGMGETDSVLVKLLLQFARHHDRSRFQVSFHAPETEAELLATPQGPAHLEAFAQLGFPVLTAPAAPTVWQSLVAAARAIEASAPHLLVTSVALADFRHYFLTALRPAPLLVGFNHGGALALFTPPILDHSLAWPLHAQLDAPCDSTLVNVETELPRREELEPLSRADLGLPADACLIMSGGRAIKFQEPRLWRAIDELLTARPEAWYVALGVAEAQVPFVAEVITPANRPRVCLPGWRSDYRRMLALADLVVDTFPMGSGVVLMDALAMGIPVVSFRHDYLQLFQQTNCSGLEILVDVPELLVPRGDFVALVERLSLLVGNPAARARLGARCQEQVQLTSGDPARMVRSAEAVYLDLARAAATPAAPATTFRRT
jgi:hypothetical protein